MGLDHPPGPVIAPTLDRGGAQDNTGGRRSVVGLRVGILDPAGQTKDQGVRWAECAEAVAEIEDDPVLRRVAGPALQLAEGVHRAAVPVLQGCRHVAALEVGLAHGVDDLAQGENLAGATRVGRGKALVRGGRNAGRTVDHVEPEMVQIGENGGKTLAVLFSVVSSCQRNGHDPFAYLRDVLAPIPDLPKERLAERLPDRWSPPQAADSTTAEGPDNRSAPTV